MIAIRKEVTIGDCRLILGNSLKVMNEIDLGDSLVSDPPYGISYKSGHATDALWKAGRSIEMDETTSARDGALSIMEGKPALVFGTWRAPRPLRTKMVLIWDKGGALGMGDLSIPWKPDHEEIYVLGKGFVGSRDRGSVLRCPPVQSMAKNGRVHPTQKPVGLMHELCRKVPGTILDPFMGSGTTLVACAKLGRKGIGVEINEAYFEIARKRVEEAYRQPSLCLEPQILPKQNDMFGGDA